MASPARRLPRFCVYYLNRFFSIPSLQPRPAAPCNLHRAAEPSPTVRVGLRPPPLQHASRRRTSVHPCIEPLPLQDHGGQERSNNSSGHGRGNDTPNQFQQQLPAWMGYFAPFPPHAPFLWVPPNAASILSPRPDAPRCTCSGLPHVWVPTAHARLSARLHADCLEISSPSSPLSTT